MIKSFCIFLRNALFAGNPSLLVDEHWFCEQKKYIKMNEIVKNTCFSDLKKLKNWCRNKNNGFKLLKIVFIL